MAWVDVRESEGKVHLKVGEHRVFSVDTRDEAYALLVFTCSIGKDGQFDARELEKEVSEENLRKFRHRLADAYKVMKNKEVSHG